VVLVTVLLLLQGLPWWRLVLAPEWPLPVTILGTVIAAAFLKGVLFPRRGDSHGDLLLYVGVAVGLFFFFKLIATGSL